jgi:hypothetical protein
MYLQPCWDTTHTATAPGPSKGFEYYSSRSRSLCQYADGATLLTAVLQVVGGRRKPHGPRL